VASFTQFSAFYNFGSGAAAAMPLLLVALAGLFIEEHLLRAKAYEFGWRLKRDRSTIALGRAVPFILSLVIILACLLVGAPLAALLWRGFTPSALSEAVDRAGGSAVRSVLYAGMSASVLSALGFFLAYLVQRRAIAGWRWIDALLLFLFTLPGSVIGIGLI